MPPRGSVPACTAPSPGRSQGLPQTQANRGKTFNTRQIRSFRIQMQIYFYSILKPQGPQLHPKSTWSVAISLKYKNRGNAEKCPTLRPQKSKQSENSPTGKYCLFRSESRFLLNPRQTTLLSKIRRQTLSKPIKQCNKKGEMQLLHPPCNLIHLLPLTRENKLNQFSIRHKKERCYITVLKNIMVQHILKLMQVKMCQTGDFNTCY